MKYAVDMVSDAMMYMPRFIQIDSVIQKLLGGNTPTLRQHVIA
jgi:hypothetical protein